ncbi:MAG: hypothetical protein HY812_04270 [Planctomycetes bacterium]|nr:hypothetical protein [Planctomycetota bacterium]
MKAGQRRAARALGWYFRRNGYVRRQNAKRVAKEGWQQYKKGDEVRLVANSAVELRILRRLVVQVGLKPGRAFRKGRQYRLPIYGREAVARFLEIIEEEDA